MELISYPTFKESDEKSAILLKRTSGLVIETGRTICSRSSYRMYDNELDNPWSYQKRIHVKEEQPRERENEKQKGNTPGGKKKSFPSPLKIKDGKSKKYLDNF